MNQYQYYKTKLQNLPYPHAVLDLALFRKNIEKNLKRAGTKNIRIASKSLRCTEAMRLILDQHSQFKGIMTYHGQEALHLIQEGFDDLLMGYPIVETALIEEMGKAIKSGKYICFMVDSTTHLDILHSVAQKLNTPFPICVDLDLSDHYPFLRFGVWRSSIIDLQKLDAFLEHLKKRPFLRLDGLMGYEAQVAGVGDQVPKDWMKNQIIRMLKKRSLSRIAQRRKAAVELMESKGFELRFVNGGGTGSLESTIQEAAVTEVTVGSGFYNPHLFDNYRQFALQPALFYAIPVVRKPTAKYYTCHGGGFIASGGIDKTKAPIVHLPDTGTLDQLEGAGEVQTPIRFSDAQIDLQLGDPVYLRHAKAGELCERFNHLYLLTEKDLQKISTYRGMGWSFG